MKLTLSILAAIAAELAAQASGYWVTLGWTASPGRVAGYRVYYGGRSKVYTNTVEAFSGTSCNVSNLVGGATYFFAVTAYDSAGIESDFSNEISYSARLPRPVLNTSNVLVEAPVLFWASTNLANWAVVDTGTAFATFPLTNRARFFFVTPASNPALRLPATIEKAP